jgi:hypothetical protein
MRSEFNNMVLLWGKLIGSVVFMLAALAMIAWFILGISFDDFWMQIALYFIALTVGIIGVMIAFRTKLIVIR